MCDHECVTLLRTDPDNDEEATVVCEGWRVRGEGDGGVCVQVGRVVGIINSVCILIFIV